VTRSLLDVDPYEHDSARWGTSLAHTAQLSLPCLQAAGARSVVEIGAYAGDFTRVLVAWAAEHGARVSAIDPAPEAGLVALDRQHPDLELIRTTSLEALPEVPLPDAVVIDGDHNYWTVREELRLIGERAPGAALPLLLFHDVCWPHGRRDDYFDAEAIPPGARHPQAGGDGGLFPGDPGLRRDGLPYPRSAAREGGPRNGVLTAIEDFVADREGLRLAVVPVFFGLGLVWHRDAPWADAVAAIVDPWDRNPVLERLEANRVHQIAQAYQATARLERHAAGQEALLRRMLESSAFAVAERLSRVRVRLGIAPSQSVISRDEIRRVLSD
jgi:methyltransferase family protein